MNSRIFVLLSFIICLHSSSSWAKSSVETLFSDENLKIEVIYSQIADITQEKWLYFKIKNKSNSEIHLQKFKAAIGSLRTNSKGGDPYLDQDYKGESTRVALFPSEDDYKIYPRRFIINAGTEVESNAQLADYAMVLHLQRSLASKGEGFYLTLNFKYQIEDVILEKEIQQELKNIQIVELAEMSNLEMVKKRMISLSKENFERMSTKHYVESYLLKTELTQNLMSDEQMINACLNIKETSRHLQYQKILYTRNLIPNDKLTRHYYKRIIESDSIGVNTIPISSYWDNSFVDAIIVKNKRPDQLYSYVYKNKKHWFQDTVIRNKLYGYFKKYNILENAKSLSNNNIEEWYKQVKYQAITGHPEVIKQLEILLDDERVFALEERGLIRSGFNRNIKHYDKRICDIAFVQLFMALGKLTQHPTNPSNRLYLDPDFVLDLKLNGTKSYIGWNLIKNSSINKSRFNLNPERKLIIKNMIQELREK